MSDGLASLSLAAETALIRKIASIASAIGFGSGEQAMEIAGQFVSVLAAKPELIGRFLAEGDALFFDGSFNVENGCLHYRANNGRMVSPAELRRKMGIEQ